MQFDPTHKPAYEIETTLPEHIRQAMVASFYRRRKAGLNVQFVSATGLDEWSFADSSRRDAFVRRMVDTNREFAISR